MNIVLVLLVLAANGTWERSEQSFGTMLECQQLAQKITHDPRHNAAIFRSPKGTSMAWCEVEQ